MSDLAEKDAIRELMAEYCFRLDNDRFADMAALFTSDGTWDTAFGKGTGHAEIEALVRRIRGAGPRPKAGWRRPIPSETPGARSSRARRQF